MFQQAITILDLIGRQFGSERRNNGHSTIDILLGAHPWRNVLQELRTEPEKHFSWDCFLAAIDSKDPIGALKITGALFLAMPTKPNEIYAKLIGICKYFLQTPLAVHLLATAKADGTLTSNQLSMCYNEMLNCYAKTYDYLHADLLVDEMLKHQIPLSVNSYSALMEAFVKATELEVASRISRESDKAYARSRQSFLKHIIEEQRRRIDIAPALEIYRKALCGGFTPNGTMLTLMLELACRGRNVELAEQILLELNMLRIPIDGHICSLLTHIYASAGLIDKAEAIVNNLSLIPGSASPTYALNALLEYYSSKGNVTEAMRTFEKLEGISSKPPFIAFSMLFGMFLDLGRIFDALQVLERMKACGHAPSRRNYNDLLSYYYKNNQYSQFFALVKHVEESGMVQDKFERTMIIAMYGKNGKVQKLIEFWHKLKHNPRQVSLAEYSSIVRYLLYFEEDETLGDVIEHIGRTAIFSCDSLYASRTFLFAFTRLGEFEAVHQCLEKLLADGSPPDAHMYNMVLHSMALHGWKGETSRILAMMNRSHCRKTNTTFALAIYLAGANGDKNLIVKLWNEYLKTHSRIMAEPVKGMMIALCRVGLAEDAVKLFEAHVRPNRSLSCEPLYSLYIEALVLSDRTDDAWTVLDEMRQLGIPYHGRTFNIFLDHHSRRIDEANFAKVTDRMRAENIAPNAFTLALHVRLRVLQGRYEDAVTLVAELQRTNAAIADKARIYLISGLLRNSHHLEDRFYSQAREHSAHLSTNKTSVYVAWILYFGRLRERERMRQTLDGILAQGIKPPQWLIEYVDKGCASGGGETMKKL